MVFSAGAIEYSYTVTNSVTGLPIEGVEVWFSTDVARDGLEAEDELCLHEPRC